MKLRTFLLACMICALCVVPASALEYSYDGADDFLFARPTSDDTIYEEENPNVDRSKNVALVAPGFGTPTSYLPGSGEHLTPNLVSGALSGGLVNQVGGANYSVSEDSVSSGMGGFLPSTSILDSGSSGNATPPEHLEWKCWIGCAQSRNQQLFRQNPYPGGRGRDHPHHQRGHPDL